ncbi:MAG: hypothetical protein OEV92_07790 [Nitrospinota bacterium]|nr:hypothetical protein [Nitrospinota bacterium]
MINFQIVSDISLLLVLTPKLENPLTREMEEKFTQILTGELTTMNIHLASCEYRENYHLFRLASPPEVSPLAAASLIMDRVTRSFINSFDELAGWGNIYHDRVFIKTGDQIPEQQLEDLLNLSLGGL